MKLTDYYLQTKKFYNEADANTFLKDLDASLIKDIIRNTETDTYDSYTVDGDPVVKHNCMQVIIINYYHKK